MTPEFLRRYYVMRIITNPKVYKLPEGHVTLKQLQKTLEAIRNEENNKEDELYSKLEQHGQKTIQRDLKKIESYYKIVIKLKRNYGYYVDDEDFKDSDNLKEVYEKTELYLLNHHAHAWKAYVTSARTSLSQHVDIVGLINAIEHQFLVELEYKGWYDDNKFQTFTGLVQPLHLKEINNAWYLMAQVNDNGVQAFCLDKRVSLLKVTTKTASKSIIFNESDYFKNAIGILKTGMQPEWIHLKVANHHLKYLEANPMHHSQQILAQPLKPETTTIDHSDLDIWGEIKICVEPNYEFLMEILKYNTWVKVIKPAQVKNYVHEHVKQMLAYYE